MTSPSESEVSENELEVPSPVEGERVFAGILDEDRLQSGDPRIEDEWRSKMTVARAALEELLCFGFGGDIGVQLRVAGTVSWRELLERRGVGGVTGLSAGTSPGELGVIWVEPVASGLLLECLLGGSIPNAVPVSRELSELERQFLGETVAAIGNILFPAQAAAAGKESSESSFGIIPNYQLEQSIDLEGHATCAEFQITFADDISGSLLALAPIDSANLRGLDSVAATASSGSVSRAARRRRLEKLGAVMLDFEVTLEGNSIALADIAGLQVGDVIALDSELAAPLTGSLNSSCTFEGSVVPAGPRKVFRVERVIPRLSSTPSGAGVVPPLGSAGPKP